METVKRGEAHSRGEVSMLKDLPRRAPLRFRALPGGLLALALSLAVPCAAPGEDAAPVGLTVQFPAVLTSDAATRLRDALVDPTKRYQAEKHLHGDRLDGFKLLCDFNPDGKP